MKRSKHHRKNFNQSDKPALYKLAGNCWMCKSRTVGIVKPTWQEAYETWSKLNG